MFNISWKNKKRGYYKLKSLIYYSLIFDKQKFVLFILKFILFRVSWRFLLAFCDYVRNFTTNIANKISQHFYRRHTNKQSLYLGKCIDNIIITNFTLGIYIYKAVCIMHVSPGHSSMLI